IADCTHHSDRCIGALVILGDTERAARYVCPFVDRRWRVPFVVVDLLGCPPRILEGPFRLDNYRYRTTTRLSELRPIESVPLGEFGALLHFDPWWVFRGVLEVQREWVEAIFATNIAHPFRHQRRTFKVQDLVCSNRLHSALQI